jgi:hypothetical protein
MGDVSHLHEVVVTLRLPVNTAGDEELAPKVEAIVSDIRANVGEVTEAN